VAKKRLRRDTLVLSAATSPARLVAAPPLLGACRPGFSVRRMLSASFDGGPLLKFDLFSATPLKNVEPIHRFADPS